MLCFAQQKLGRSGHQKIKHCHCTVPQRTLQERFCTSPCISGFMPSISPMVSLTSRKLFSSLVVLLIGRQSRAEQDLSSAEKAWSWSEESHIFGNVVIIKAWGQLSEQIYSKPGIDKINKQLMSYLISQCYWESGHIETTAIASWPPWSSSCPSRWSHSLLENYWLKRNFMNIILRTFYGKQFPHIYFKK